MSRLNLLYGQARKETKLPMLRDPMVRMFRVVSMQHEEPTIVPEEEDMVTGADEVMVLPSMAKGEGISRIEAIEDVGMVNAVVIVVDMAVEDLEVETIMLGTFESCSHHNTSTTSTLSVLRITISL